MIISNTLASETAYAKINLALHLRRRRGDGYHAIETLFAFVDAGDALSFETATRDELRVTGEFAPALTDRFGNIVAQAVGNVAGGVAAAFGMGGFGLGKTRKFEFTAKPGNYEQGATKAASLANERVSAQLSAMK